MFRAVGTIFAISMAASIQLTNPAVAGYAYYSLPGITGADIVTDNDDELANYLSIGMGGNWEQVVICFDAGWVAIASGEGSHVGAACGFPDRESAIDTALRHCTGCSLTFSGYDDDQSRNTTVGNSILKSLMYH